MTAPRRIQRRRTRGWRMPAGAVYVGRPSRWGNPFRVGGMIVLTGDRAGEKVNAEEAVSLFRHYANGETAKAAEFRALARAELAGRDLACWCPLDQACHADVLLDIANSPGQG